MKTTSARVFCMYIYMLIPMVATCLSARAAESADSAVSLKEISVTAISPRRLSTVQELAGAELQALSTTSIADALKYFAGVQIKDFGGLGGLKTVNVRSLGAQHVGVYIDGVRITNAQNGTVDLGKFSLSTLESVSLYNANKLDACQSASEYASGATVYMRTRVPTSDSLSLTGRWASFHTYMGRINAQYARKGWKGFVDGEYLNSRGDYPFRYKSEYEDTVGRRRNSDIEYGRVEAALFKGGFSSHLYYYQSVRGCPGGIVRRLSDKYTNVGREWDTDCFAQASYRYWFGNYIELKINGRYAYEYLRYCTDYPENQNTAKVNNHYHQHDAYASAAATYYPWDWLSVNVSYDMRMSWLDADLKMFHSVRRSDSKAVAAAQASYRSFRLAATMLYQHYHDFTRLKTGAADPLSRFTPTVSLVWNYGTLTLKTWYKSIFRVPTLNDLYYTQAGNRNLKPEYTRQFDLGAEYNFTSRPWMVSIQADAYINHVYDRIVCLPLRGTYTWSMLNYGETYCRGLNMNVSGRYMTGPWNFSLLASFTWQRDLNRTDPSDTDTYNHPICYSPTLSTGITAITAWRQWSLTVSEMYVGKRIWSYADPEDILRPYNNVDLKLSASFPHVLVAAEVNDVFDVQYEHIPRYPMPGRNFRLTATYIF